MKVTVVIPAYHEKGNVSELSVRLQRVFVAMGVQFEIFFVIQGDDGSLEALDELSKHEIPSLRWAYFPSPLGVGAAFCYGFQNISPDCTHVLTLDADLNHQPEELPLFVTEVRKHEVDIVVGSRYVRGGSQFEGLPFWKFASSRLVNDFLSYTTDLKISDKTSGYRLMRREVVDCLVNASFSRGYDFYLEFMWRAHRAGFNIVEVPIEFKARKTGRSKMPKIRTFLSYLFLLLRTYADLVRKRRPGSGQDIDHGNAASNVLVQKQNSEYDNLSLETCGSSVALDE